MTTSQSQMDILDRLDKCIPQYNRYKFRFYIDKEKDIYKVTDSEGNLIDEFTELDMLERRVMPWEP